MSGRVRLQREGVIGAWGCESAAGLAHGPDWPVGANVIWPGGFMSAANDQQEPRALTRARARLRQKAQITLPEEVRQVLHVGEGDEVEFTVDGDGSVTVRGYVSVPSDQAWFFTPERLAGKRQAEDEIAMDEGIVHDSGEAMFAHLASLGRGES